MTETYQTSNLNFSQEGREMRMTETYLTSCEERETHGRERLI